MRSSYHKEKKQIQNYIEKNLQSKLQTDQQNCKIVAEGDLQSCTYHHLRIFVDGKKMSNWHVLNKLSMGKKTESKKYPDIAIVYLKNLGKKVYPIFLFELKETINFRVTAIEKDISKLIKKNKMKLEMTYIIYSVLDDKIHPNDMDEEILVAVPEKFDGWITPISVNVLGTRELYPKESKNLFPKIEKLRKYRN